MKYKFTGEIKKWNGGVTLHRIVATKNIPSLGVKKGDLGGWIRDKWNLSQTGSAWVYGDAIVTGNAHVWGDARVNENAYVLDNASIYGKARIFGYAVIGSNAEISGDALVYGDAMVVGNAEVFGDAYIFGAASVRGNARVGGYTKVCGNAKIDGSAYLYGDATICGDTKIYCDDDYIVFKNWWSSGRYFTWTRSNNMWSVGCFYGTGKELIEKAYQDSEKSGQEYKRVVKYVESILKEENGR